MKKVYSFITSMTKKPTIVKDDCDIAIRSLIDIFQRNLRPESFDLMIYGSYVRKWRESSSDLDGMLFFNSGPLLEIMPRTVLLKIHEEFRVLYKKRPSLKSPRILGDVFIMDRFQGIDGRFVVHDADSFMMFLTPGHYIMAYGIDFVPGLRPMSLRNQDEFYLAVGLQKIRNYLFFEIPKPFTDVSTVTQEETLKYLRVLPRIVSKLLNEPTDPIPDAIELLCKRFPYIDYRPLRDLWNICQDRQEIENLFKEWHRAGSTTFHDCWQYYERTLMSIAERLPAKSRRD